VQAGLLDLSLRLAMRQRLRRLAHGRTPPDPRLVAQDLSKSLEKYAFPFSTRFGPRPDLAREGE
jgi:hypothetical protein